MRKQPTLDQLKEYFDYNPYTGELVHKITRPGTIKGTNAIRHRDGKAFTNVNDSSISTARIIWWIYYGSKPTSPVVHINGDKLDNRIENLMMLDAMPNGNLTHEALLTLVHYDPEKGSFTHNSNKSYNAIKGNPIKLSLSAKKYHQITLLGKNYLAHRIAWFYMNGSWPPVFVDHINGDKQDNRYKNLRLATKTESARNQGLRCTNKSGVKGVYWLAKKQRWQAQVTVNRKKLTLGRYKTLKQAQAAVTSAREKHHGEYCNHGTFKVVD